MSSKDETISNADFARLRALVYEKSGINLSAEKKTMLELRVKRRLKTLELSSYSRYCEYLFGQEGQKEELVQFLDVVTTNKTDFFRERDHFDYLVQKALPDFVARFNCERPLRVWSAGCSTGEEPYTLAMLLREFAKSHTGFCFQVLATDLSTTVLAKAERGIYSETCLGPVSMPLRQEYFMRSRDRESALVRVVPELRNCVEFRRLNFKDADYGLADTVDIVFCRNVIIYFDRATQEQILQKIVRHLMPGGFAFVGHSESLHGMELPLAPIAPAVYRRTGGRQ